MARAFGSYPECRRFESHCRYQIWPGGQAVKTPPFHGGNTGSIPVRVTKAPKMQVFGALTFTETCQSFVLQSEGFAFANPFLLFCFFAYRTNAARSENSDRAAAYKITIFTCVMIECSCFYARQQTLICFCLGFSSSKNSAWFHS